MLVFLATATACARTSELGVPARPAQWQPFYWADVAAGGTPFPHAAIVLDDPRATRPGGESLLQLDLAASGAWPLGFPGDRPPETVAAIDVRLHGLLAQLEPVGLMRTRPGPPPPARLRRLGTLGLPSFGFDLLFLDFAAERVGIAPSRRSDDGRWGGSTVPLEPAGDQVIVALEPAGGPPLRTLLDTGLSPFPLWTGPTVWRSLTGRSLDDVRNRHYTLPHPRGALRFIAAPSAQPIALGHLALRALEVVTLDPAPAGEGVWPFDVDAMLSTTAFAGSRAALVLDARGRHLVVFERSPFRPDR